MRWTPDRMASGRKKATKAKRRRRKATPHGKALTVFWEVGGTSLLGLAYLMQAEALLISGLVSMAVGAVGYWFDTHPNNTVSAPAGSPARTAQPPKTQRSGGGSRKPGTAVICTQSGLPTDQCKGNHMHVMSQGGLDRYRRRHNVKRIGDPYGTKADKRSTASTAAAKTPKVPTTNNARPLPPGERMRRVV